MKTVRCRIGWSLFLVGSVGFALDGIRTGDIVSVFASVLFVVGVVAFLVAERDTSACPLCGRSAAPQERAMVAATRERYERSDDLPERAVRSGVELGQV
jgi:hypothetical protein